MLVRLQKYLADSGVASRRKSEELITSGRVKVNGKIVTELGSKIDPINHKVQVDNEYVQPKKTNSYIAFHKPRGVLSTMSDPEGRQSLGDYFSGHDRRLFHVGRLDRESEGLMLLTDDGAFAHQVSHPSFGVEKLYLVLPVERLNRAQIEEIARGVRLEDGYAKPISIREVGQWIEIRIHEGRNQIIRRIFAAVGAEVDRLLRTEIGPVKLGELPPGRQRHLNEVELTNLQSKKSRKR